ncbi:unnamed protein product [Boreogadus saida]
MSAVAALESEVGNPNAAVFGCMIEFRSALTGGSRGVPRPVLRYNLSTYSWVFPEVSSPLDVPETPPKGGAQWASLPDARTTSADSFLSKGAAALIRVPHG